MYHSIDQVCKRLQKNERQIRYMVKQGRLTPVNPDTFRRDGGYRFSEEEIQRVERTLNIPGLSVKEAAQEIGITPQYLLQFVSSGDVQSEVKWVGKKKRRYFQKEEIDNFKQRFLDGHQTNREGVYGTKVKLISREVRIFEKCYYNGVEARIIGLNPLKVLTEIGETIHLEKNDIKSSPWPDRPYIRTRGHAEFEMPVPRHPQHPVYKLLYLMVEQLGEKNIQIYETSFGDYYVRCRLGSIQTSEENFKLLQKYICIGEMVYQDGYIYFRSAEVTKTLSIPRSVWNRIEYLSSIREETVQETISKALLSYTEKQND